MTLCPKESGKKVAELAKHVHINKDGIENLGNKILQEIANEKLSISNFSQNEIHPKSSDLNALDWLFVVDSLNFCFWHHDNEEGWIIDKQHGYFALCEAINRAVEENINILDPHYYSKISKEQLLHIFRSDTTASIPIIDKRIECLHNVGSTLIEKFGGSFKNCVKQAENSAVKLLNIIVNNFECFRDEAIYQGHQVAFYKRAQILVGDVWSCFKGKGLGRFDDINEITMFADYRIPQSLLYFNVFEYSEELMNMLRANKPLENGSQMEVEIRGCSIHAVTLLVDYIKNISSDTMINATLIDHYLWDFRRTHNDQIIEKKLPFHKTYCIFY